MMSPFAIRDIWKVALIRSRFFRCLSDTKLKLIARRATPRTMVA